MKKEKITSAGPSITQLEINYVKKAISEGWQEKDNYYRGR